jgi:hypothetical protein
MICAVLVLSLAVWALINTKETYGRDMDFIET